nr:PREDICTED: LON peptidase N-terminal domain and RING finger protein 2 [Latimeria chalumnae]|eukprot:XP_014345700.1 PREDICTED: LON peptidase N-terminal domain and RING finger protein 2 [Latimeria chalumnae]
METGTLQRRSEPYFSDLPQMCLEMMEVAEEAFRAENFELAAEIYGSQLAELPHPDRGLYLRRGEALARAGRIAEALDSYSTVGNICKLRAEELRVLVESLAQNLREKELPLLLAEKKASPNGEAGKYSTVNGELKADPLNATGSKCSDSNPKRKDCDWDGHFNEKGEELDLFSCRLCNRLLVDPSTLQCGHTFCKSCLERESILICRLCKFKVKKLEGGPGRSSFKVNVVLGHFLEKWFEKESKARRLSLEGETLLGEQKYSSALEKCNQAIAVGYSVQLHRSGWQAVPSQGGGRMPRFLEPHRLKGKVPAKQPAQNEPDDAKLCPGTNAYKKYGQSCRSWPCRSPTLTGGLPPMLRRSWRSALSYASPEESLPDHSTAGCIRISTWTAAYPTDPDHKIQRSGPTCGCLLFGQGRSARYLKAQVFVALGRAEEALKEFLYCAALKPDWDSVKLEAQKIMCDVFFPTFENVHDSLPASLRSSSFTRLKPTILNSINSSPLAEDGTSEGCSVNSVFKVNKTAPQDSGMFPSAKCTTAPGLQFENSKKSLESVLSSLPGASLKRKYICDTGSSQSFEIPSKIPKQDGETVPEKAETGRARRHVPSELVDSSDFECSLCMRLFYEPVATPCGHTFCLKCLERCLDHNSNCPLCKENLSEFLATRAYNKTVLTEEMTVRYLTEELAERKKVYEEEMKELSNLSKDVPVFVCTMAFPTIPCPLHVFEPRYRLMIRRCMETGTKQFGMCIADELKGFADFGCMLEVRDVKFFPDGRSVVDTIGVSRFKVVSHGQRDGYNTANIEYLEDKKVEGQEYNELVSLHDAVYDQAVAWFTSLKEDMKTQILSHFGPMPGKESDPQSSPNGPAWCWWLLAVLPLENRAQLAILSMASLKDRLIAIRRVLRFVTRKRPR